MDERRGAGADERGRLKPVHAGRDDPQSAVPAVTSRSRKAPPATRATWRRLLLFPGLAAVAACVAGLTLYALAREPMGGTPSGERLERMKTSPNFRGGRFVNSQATEMLAPGGRVETVRMYLERAERVPKEPVPTTPVPAGSFADPPAGGLRVTWLGHSAFLVELDGARILTDPVLVSRASPFSRIGPKRFFPSPVPLNELPELDAIVISHDHYDHLAMDEVRALVPRTRAFVVPLGVGAHLLRWGVPPEKVVELDWWEEAAVGDGVRVVLTPARHFSGRGLRRDPTLWASAAFVGPSHRVFFSGDTGLTPEFAEVGRRFGPFDCTLVKIGAYGRAWPDIHVNPEQALEVHRMVRGRVLIPAHWATYNLSAHSWREPADRLVAAASGSDVTLVVPLPGQPVVPAQPPPLVRWWDGPR